VDDEDDARDLVATVLRRAGARVTTARSTAEAVGAAATDRPDVMVSDIGMPGEDGLALIGRLRELGVAVPAVALTAYAGAGDRARALSHGYRAFMPKPVEPAELVKVVADLCRRDGRGTE
jgi:CheY-like chemotaxis protein